MESPVDIDQLRTVLLDVSNKLELLQPQRPSERNGWWRKPIPGVPEIANFNSFQSLRRRDNRIFQQLRSDEYSRGYLGTNFGKSTSDTKPDIVVTVKGCESDKCADACVGTDFPGRVNTCVGTDLPVSVDASVSTDYPRAVDACVGSDLSIAMSVEVGTGEEQTKTTPSRTPLLDITRGYDGKEPEWISALYDPYAAFVPEKPDHKIRIMCNQIIPVVNAKQPILGTLPPEDHELAEIMIDCANSIFGANRKCDVELGVKVARSVLSTVNELSEGRPRQYYVDLEAIEAFNTLLWNYKDKFLGIT
jgi:hypothetical protein